MSEDGRIEIVTQTSVNYHKFGSYQGLDENFEWHSTVNRYKT